MGMSRVFMIRDNHVEITVGEEGRASPSKSQ
jgi:hypothetical protein